MDPQTQEALTYITLTISLGGVILGIINHKRIRSNCCGKQMEVSLDVENTTPPRIQDPPTLSP